MTGYRAAIFDWDGTLSDSTGAIIRSLNETLVVFGREPAPEARARGVIGLGLDRCFLELGAPEGECDAMAAHYREIHDRTAPRDARLFPGARETLATLRSRGVLLGIATSKRRATLLPILEALGLSAGWAVVVGGDDVARGKPHPEAAETALAALGVPARHALVVGDTAFDVEMGRRAGADTCAVAWGAHERERLAAAGPTHVASSFGDVVRVLLRRE